MLKKIWRVAFAILLVSLMILCCVFAFGDTKAAESDGHVNVVVKNMDGKVISSERFEYNKGDSWFELLEENYKLSYTTGLYGHFLTEINSIKTDGMSSWLWLEVAYLKDGEEYSDDLDFTKYEIDDSEVGIDGIALVDNMALGITERDNEHIISAFSDAVKVNMHQSSYKAFKIAVYALLGVFVIGLISYAVISSKKRNTPLDVKKMCILSLMAVILFVQEEALTMLPNIQLTFLLISIYAAVFGIKNSLAIVSIHVLLDNVIMGSLTPIVVVPMFLGYVVLVVVMNLVKDCNLAVKCLCASLCSLLYCYIFLIVNALFLDINVYAYWIADIPFEILLVLSTILTITYLYNPIEKIINREWNKNNVEIR